MVTVAENGEKTATVALFCDSVDRALCLIHTVHMRARGCMQNHTHAYTTTHVDVRLRTLTSVDACHCSCMQ